MSDKKNLYFTAWRWHFYAGLYVVPFLLMLAITGLIMLYGNVIESAQYSKELQVTPQTQQVPASEQLSAVQQAYPHSAIKEFIPSHSEDKANRFSIAKEDGSGWFILVNQYTGELQGEIDRDNLYDLANRIHGTLLIGDLGDRLIEIAASLGIVLLISGIYLWWPRDNASKSGFLKIRTNSGSRTLWRDLHANIGGVTGIFLLFFLLTGLAWTGIWGTKVVNGWLAFPPEKYYDIPLSDKTHAHMNHGGQKEVAWHLEPLNMPESQAPETHEHHKVSSGDSESDDGTVDIHAAHKATSVVEHYSINPESLDKVIEIGNKLGFGYFRVFLPQDDTGVFTLSADTISGDIKDPTQDRTVHIDQYTHEIIIDFNWDNYSLLAKTMAAGTALHEGELGWWNFTLNTIFCLSFAFLAISGIIMWWKRRPANSKGLVAPPMPSNPRLWKTALIIIIITACLFPMAGLAIIVVMLLDYIVIRRIDWIKNWLN